MTDDEKMMHLQNAVTGSARATIGGMVCDGSSYADALQALQERYGRSIDIIQATLRVVFSCPAPKGDVKSLEKYHGALHGAVVTMKKMGYEGDLKSCENLRRVVSKLPLEMRRKWAEHSLDMEQPTLISFDEWLQKEVRVALSCEATTPASGQQKRTVATTAVTSSTGGEPASFAVVAMGSGSVNSSNPGQRMSGLRSLPLTVSVTAACDPDIRVGIVELPGCVASTDLAFDTTDCYMAVGG